MHVDVVSPVVRVEVNCHIVDCGEMTSGHAEKKEKKLEYERVSQCKKIQIL